MNAFLAIRTGSVVAEDEDRCNNRSPFFSAALPPPLSGAVFRQVGTWPAEIAQGRSGWAIHSNRSGSLVSPLVAAVREILIADLYRIESWIP